MAEMVTEAPAAVADHAPASSAVRCWYAERPLPESVEPDADTVTGPVVHVADPPAMTGSDGGVVSTVHL